MDPTVDRPGMGGRGAGSGDGQRVGRVSNGRGTGGMRDEQTPCKQGQQKSGKLVASTMEVGRSLGKDEND